MMQKISRCFNIFKQYLNTNLKESLLCFIIIINSLVILIGNIHVSLILDDENIEFDMFFLLIFSLLTVLMIISGIVTVMKICSTCFY